MNDKTDTNNRILRSAKFKTDDTGRTTLTESEDASELELMSTQMLEAILDTSDFETTNNLREIAKGESGLVAKDVESNRFKVISDDELEKILDGTDGSSDDTNISEMVGEDPVEVVSDEESLDLVSTQMLQIALDVDGDVDEKETEEKFVLDRFDPYNKV